MKKGLLALRLFALVTLATLTNTALADAPLVASGPSLVSDLPTTEKEFVSAINKFNKKNIVEKLGEPSDAEDVKLKGSDKVVASIWHYHYLNTAPDGSYYQTTELDFIDDKVVVVVFLNNDGTEGVDSGQKYELPNTAPNL